MTTDEIDLIRQVPHGRRRANLDRMLGCKSLGSTTEVKGDVLLLDADPPRLLMEPVRRLALLSGEPAFVCVISCRSA